MITIHINNTAMTIEPQMLDTVIEAQTQGIQQFAVAVNNEFVPKSQYGKTSLQDGDMIDIVSPVGGG